jgi:thioredoxin reductase
MLDVFIVGGGAAGLSAALVLGRMCRNVMVCDAGEPRNKPSSGVHAFLSRDGIAPAELLQISREQLQPYSTVQLKHGQVTHIHPLENHFEITLQDGARYQARKIILATGVRDQLPDIQGLQILWGKSVFHCPYCHGWEARHDAIAVLANGERAVHITSLLLALTSNIVICTNGASEIDAHHLAQLQKFNVSVYETPIRQVHSENGQLHAIEFEDSSLLKRSAIFVSPKQQQQSDLAPQLGCKLTEMGHVQVDEQGQTTVPGVYAAGDLVSPMQQVIHAASRGASAAAMINAALAKEAFNQV